MKSTAPALPLITQVNHTAESLGLSQDELARILGLHYDDVTDSVQLEMRFENNTVVRHKAERLVVFCQLLAQHSANEQAKMRNWLSKDHARLATSPILAIVDEGRLEDVINLLAS